MSGDLAAVGALSESWTAACRSRDTERIVAHLAEDAVVWFNFEQVEHDRDGYRAILERSAAGFRNQIYKDMRVHLHAGGFAEQATLVGETDQGIVETPFLLIASVRGERIVRIDEYFDTTVMQAGREKA